MWKINKNIFVNIADESKIELTITNKPKTNGSTNKRGKISLSQERLDRVINLFKKITKGDIDSITKDEADAAATLWHEITHNKHDISYDKKTGKTTEREKNFKELANEYVARHTLDEFYKILGITKTPHPELITNRPEVGYNPWVRNYQQIISYLKLDETIILNRIKQNLFTGDYREQKRGMAQALLDGGLNEYKYKKKDKEIKVGIDEAERLISVCLDEYADIEKEIKRTLPNFHK